MEDTKKIDDVIHSINEEISDQQPEEPRANVEQTQITPKLDQSIDEDSPNKTNGAQPAPGSIFPSQDFTNPYIALVPKLRERSKSKENVQGTNTLDDLVQASEREL